MSDLIKTQDIIGWIVSRAEIDDLGQGIAHLAISQAETIRLQGEEIERISKRLGQEKTELEQLKQERDEAYRMVSEETIRALKSEPNLHTNPDEGPATGGDVSGTGGNT